MRRLDPFEPNISDPNFCLRGPVGTSCNLLHLVFCNSRNRLDKPMEYSPVIRACLLERVRQARRPMSARVLSLSVLCLFAVIAPASPNELVEGANFRIAGRASRAIQKYSGLTWCTDRVLSTTGGIAAKVALGGHPKVRVRSYSFTDALSGKFRLVELQLHNCSYQRVPLPDLKLSTTTPLHIGSKSRILTPVMVSVIGEADEQLISRALQSPSVSSQLNFLRLDLPGLGDQHLQVINPHVRVNEGKVYIDTDLVTAGAAPETGIKVAISARPSLKNERYIILEGTKVDSKDIVEPEKFSVFIEDLLNPLIDFGRMDRTTRAFRMTELHTDNHKVRFTGKLLLAPRPVPSTPIASSDSSGKKKR